MATIDLNHLHAFTAVADGESFSAAARALGVPTSTVSRAVARLERDLGVRLLHRSTRKVALSTAGRALLDRTGPLLAQLAHAVEQLPDLDEAPTGLLRVTAPVDVGAVVLGELIPQFVTRYPQVHVELRATNDVVDLVREGIDVALRMVMRPQKDSGLVMKRLAPATIHVYAAPSYLARRGAVRSVDDALAQDWVGYTGLGPLKLVSETGETVTLSPQPHVQGDDMGFVMSAVRHGAGLGALPVFLAAPEVERGALTRVLPRFSVPGGQLAMVLPSRSGLPRKVAVFRDFLIENIRL